MGASVAAKRAAAVHVIFNVIGTTIFQCNQHEIIRMGEFARETLNDAVNYFFTKDEKLGNLALQKEEIVNDLDKKITEYLVKLQQSSMNEQESGKASILMQTINDLERIGDHAENIAQYVIHGE